MADFFQTQEQRAQRGHLTAFDRATEFDRIDQQLKRLNRLDVSGSRSAAALKSESIDGLLQARRALENARRAQPSAADVSYVKQRRVARGQLMRATASLTSATIDLLRSVYPPVAEAFERTVVPIAETAFDGWPVDTGKSRDAMQLAINMKDNRVSARMISDAPYVFYVRQGRANTSNRKVLTRGKYAWVALVRTPMYAADEQIARDIERAYRGV